MVLLLYNMTTTVRGRSNDKKHRKKP